MVVGGMRTQYGAHTGMARAFGVMVRLVVPNTAPIFAINRSSEK